MPQEICPKCETKKPMTKHHVKPVRFYGKKGNNDIVKLCRDCHDLLEKIIPQKPKMHDEFYFEVVNQFLGGNF